MSRERQVHRYAVALRAAMRAKNVGQRRLGVAVGVAESAISSYRLAKNVPTIEVARRIADVLSMPELMTLAHNARLVACENCGRQTPTDGRPRRFCNPECARVAIKKRGTTIADTRFRATTAERALAVHRDAVAEMCATCEPDGVCRTFDCPLRMVSPFRYIEPRGDVPTVIPPRQPSDTWRAAISESNRRRWTPEARAKAAEAMRVRHAQRSPEERAAFASAVSAGIKRKAAA